MDIAYSADTARRLPLPGRWLAMLMVLALTGGGATAAIEAYVWSLHVRDLHARIGALDERIGATHRQIGQLRLELAIRTRFGEQERWAPALGLRFPDSAQYGASADQLRSLAEARRDKPASLPVSAVAPAVSAVAPAATGYAPVARRQLDSLIGDLLH